MTPPRDIPTELVDQFTLGGKVGVEHWFLDETRAPDAPHIFTRSDIECLIMKASRRETQHYGVTDEYLYQALQDSPLEGKRCVVMGTQIPWYEAICLQHGAEDCTTIEYRALVSQHPGVRVLTPQQYEGHPERFQRGLSVSSFEHDGLGRYGDPVNPDGDLMAMRNMKRVLEPSGLLYLSVPVGLDKLVWNAHRVYGRIRFPLLVEGWRIRASYGFAETDFDVDGGREARHQPVFVLENS